MGLINCKTFIEYVLYITRELRSRAVPKMSVIRPLPSMLKRRSMFKCRTQKLKKEKHTLTLFGNTRTRTPDLSH